MAVKNGRPTKTYFKLSDALTFEYEDRDEAACPNPLVVQPSICSDYEQDFRTQFSRDDSSNIYGISVPSQTQQNYMDWNTRVSSPWQQSRRPIDDYATTRLNNHTTNQFLPNYQPSSQLHYNNDQFSPPYYCSAMNVPAAPVPPAAAPAAALCLPTRMSPRVDQPQQPFICTLADLQEMVEAIYKRQHAPSSRGGNRPKRRNQPNWQNSNGRSANANRSTKQAQPTTSATDGEETTPSSAGMTAKTVSSRDLMPYYPCHYSEDEVRLMCRLVFGDLIAAETSRYHLLVSKVLLFAYKSLREPTITTAIKSGSRLSGAVAFTVHKVTNSHFFSIILDFNNVPSFAAKCWRTRKTRNGSHSNAVSSLGGRSSTLAGKMQLFVDEQDFSTENCNDDASSLQGSVETLLGAPRLVSIYPSIDCNACDSTCVSRGSYWISWNTKLAGLPQHLSNPFELKYSDGTPVKKSDAFPCTWIPFCCRGIVKMHHRRLRRDFLFQALVSHRGSHPDIVYEVKTMQPLSGVYDEAYYQLIDDKVVQLAGPFHTKIHAFKNYYCTIHKFWFSVDLFKKEEDETDYESDRPLPVGDLKVSSSNCHRHSVRVNPFTHLENWVFTDHFFRSVGFPDLSEETAYPETDYSDLNNSTNLHLFPNEEEERDPPDYQQNQIMTQGIESAAADGYNLPLSV